MDTMRGPEEEDLPESVIYDTVSGNNMILIPRRDAIYLTVPS